MNAKYCRYCGKELTPAWTGFYDEETGEKEMKPYCEACYGNRTAYNGIIGRFD